jgi:cation:H+ antiporter
MTIIFLLLGLATLIVGGEFLVKGSIGIAKKFNISSLVIGMTVISFGTSAPELIVSIKSALSGNPEIALGNVIGSNIANIGLILGITVLIFPIIINRNTKILDWPVMFGASLLFFFFAYDGIISRFEGMTLFTLLITFTVFLIRKSRKEPAVPTKEDEPTMKPMLAVGYLLLGLVGLYFGAEWLLDSAVKLAKDFGMEERVIAITIVAFGTSVPELITSCIAAFKKETDIAIGNLIGSNIFNIMSVVGLTAFVEPMKVSDNILNIDMLWMLGLSLLLLPLIMFGKKLGKFKGALLLSVYIIYISTLLLA